MTKFERAYRTRDAMLQRLEEDLLGGDFDTVLTEEPLSRFVVGVLYPATEDGDAGRDLFGGSGPLRFSPPVLGLSVRVAPVGETRGTA